MSEILGSGHKHKVSFGKYDMSINSRFWYFCQKLSESQKTYQFYKETPTWWDCSEFFCPSPIFVYIYIIRRCTWTNYTFWGVVKYDDFEDLVGNRLASANRSSKVGCTFPRIVFISEKSSSVFQKKVAPWYLRFRLAVFLFTFVFSQLLRNSFSRIVDELHCDVLRYAVLDAKISSASLAAVMVLFLTVSPCWIRIWQL